MPYASTETPRRLRGTVEGVKDSDELWAAPCAECGDLVALFRLPNGDGSKRFEPVAGCLDDDGSLFCDASCREAHALSTRWALTPAAEAMLRERDRLDALKRSQVA